jgi:transcriptional regulator with XRE-family HTH domain
MRRPRAQSARRAALVGSSRPQTTRLAEKLRDIRDRLGLSQVQMVERLKDQKLPEPLKVYAGNISRFEQGLREPPLRVLLGYARAAGVSIEVLVDAHLDLPQRLTANAGLAKARKSEQVHARSTKRRPKAITKKKIPRRRA